MQRKYFFECFSHAISLLMIIPIAAVGNGLLRLEK